MRKTIRKRINRATWFLVQVMRTHTAGITLLPPTPPPRSPWHRWTVFHILKLTPISPTPFSFSLLWLWKKLWDFRKWLFQCCFVRRKMMRPLVLPPPNYNKKRSSSTFCLFCCCSYPSRLPSLGRQREGRTHLTPDKTLNLDTPQLCLAITSIFLYKITLVVLAKKFLFFTYYVILQKN